MRESGQTTESFGTPTAADTWAWWFASSVFLAGIVGLACAWFAYLARLWPTWSNLDRILMVAAVACGLASIPLFLVLKLRPSRQGWVVALPIALGAWVFTHDPMVVVMPLAMHVLRTLFGRRLLEAIQAPPRAPRQA